MNIRKTIISATVALTMVAMIAPVSAGAVTVAELQAQINALMAQLAQLQQGGQTAPVSGVPAACAGITFTRNLGVGSTGSDVTCLQALLNVSPMSGYFGPITLAAVQTYQTQQGWTPASQVGPMTRAKLNAWLGGSPLTPSTPSTPTAGCPPGAIYNFMTGALCAGTPTTLGLTGTANIKSVSDLSQYALEDVGEGESNVIVLGKEIEMDNTGNARLQQVRVAFDRAGGTEVSGSSDRFDRYASKVSIMLNGAEVGSIAPSALSRDSAGLYSGTIILSSSAILNSGAKNNLTIAVSALANIDSGDEGEQWDTWIVNIRYVDATGAIITDSSTTNLAGTVTGNANAEIFAFKTLASSVDLKLRLNVASDNPIAKAVEVSTTVDTQNVGLLNFTLRAQGGQIWIDELPILVTVSSPTGLAEVSDIVAKISLKLGSKTFSETLTGDCLTTFVCTVTFDDLDYTLGADQTVSGSVTIDVQELAGLEFLAASSAKADITATERDLIIAEDTNGDTVASGSRTGVVTGEIQTFYKEGVYVSNFSSSATQITNEAGAIITTTYTLTYKVTAFGNTFYIPKTTARGTTGTTEGAHFVTLLAGTINTSGTTVASSITSSDAQTVASRFEVPEGETRTFSFQVIVDASGDAGFFRVRLAEAGYVTVSSGGTVVYYAPTPVQSFETVERKVD